MKIFVLFIKNQQKKTKNTILMESIQLFDATGIMSQSNLNLVQFILEMAVTKRAFFHVQQMHVILEPILIMLALRIMGAEQIRTKIQITKFTN